VPDQQDILVLAGEGLKCPFCRKAMTKETIEPAGFISISEILVSNRHPPNFQAFVSRHQLPLRPGEYAYAVAKCRCCGIQRPVPHSALPPPIRDRVYEAMLCHQVGAYDAMALMCRAVVEQIATDLTRCSGTLVEKLRSAVSKGVIGGFSSRAAFTLTGLGNRAAHSANGGCGLPTDDVGEAGSVLFLTLGLVQALFLFPPTERELPDGSIQAVWVERSTA